MNRRGADRIGPLGSSGVIAQWGASSLIRSAQTASGTASAAVTIAAVDTANTIVLFGNNSFSAYNDTKQYWFARVSAISPTSVTFTVNTGGGGAVAKASVLEFVPGVIKSIQYSTIAFTTETPTKTGTITAVDTAKSVVLFMGTTSNDNTGGYPAGNNNMCSVILTNSTTVTAQRGEYWAAGGSPTVGFCVVEFF